MKKQKSNFKFLEEILPEILLVVVEVALALLVFAIGYGALRLIGIDAFQSDPEWTMLVGIGLIALVGLLICGLVYCIRKTIRFFRKK